MFNIDDKVRDFISRVELYAKKKPFLIVSAPGRMDFLNTHQDYKGLPVVPIAVNLRTYIGVIEERSGEFGVHSLTLLERGEEHIDRFKTKKPSLVGRGWFGDYLRAVLRVVNERFGSSTVGGELVVYSDVPIGSGLASSAALEVAFGEFLNNYWDLGLNRMELAETCFKAEKEVMGIPCGRLDQYSSAIGGAILLYPRPPVRYESLTIQNARLVAVDSGIRHSVGSIHPVRQRELNEGLGKLLKMGIPPYIRRHLSDSFDKVNWEEITYGELKPYLQDLGKPQADRIAYTLLANESTRHALELLRSGSTDLEELAKIINEQHELLRDLYEVSLPELEKIRNSMLEAGALGVKISGAGMGGCLIALCRDEESSRAVLQAASDAGAVKGWLLKIDRGSSLDYTE